MCEMEKQINELLTGTKPSNTTRAVKILAMDLDKRFLSVDNKLDAILSELKNDRESTNEKLQDITEKVDNHILDNKLSLPMYMSQHPKVFLFVVICFLLIVGYAIAKSDFINIFKLV